MTLLSPQPCALHGRLQGPVHRMCLSLLSYAYRALCAPCTHHPCGHLMKVEVWVGYVVVVLLVALQVFG